MNESHCGYVAIIGRPNVGKSTLLNRILGEKLCITSRKPQTTRHRILGIKTDGERQTVYVDTPGLHQKNTTQLNRYMNRTARAALKDVDIVLFVVDATRWTEDDEWVLKRIQKLDCPVILALNKADRLPDKTDLLPQIEKFAAQFTDIIPISAKTGFNVPELENVVAKYLPVGPHFYPDDQITDRSERFLAAELIREKLMRGSGQEVPYSTSVEIEEYKLDGNLLRIRALIWVEKAGQKAIIIGAHGQKLKEIGQQARLDMEKRFGHKVFLQLWVKVKEGWSNDERALRSLDYFNF